MTTQTFTGAQLLDVLKDQWCGTNSRQTVLLPSSTITTPTDQSVADAILGDPCAGAANPVTGVTINGAALNPAASYRITTNNFLADGGDDFQSLKQGTNRTTLPGPVRHRLAGGLPRAGADRVPPSGRRRWIGSTSTP